MWGWATWSRSWKHYDLQMTEWNNENKKKFLKKWCLNKNLKKQMRKFFDLHCENSDPWTWDYQWFYACWRNNGLAVISSQNIVSNIGIGPNATHTISENTIPLFPEKLGSIKRPLRHPLKVERNIYFEKKYRSLEQPSLSRKIKNMIKQIFFFK